MLPSTGAIHPSTRRHTHTLCRLKHPWKVENFHKTHSHHWASDKHRYRALLNWLATIAQRISCCSPPTQKPRRLDWLWLWSCFVFLFWVLLRSPVLPEQQNQMLAEWLCSSKHPYTIIRYQFTKSDNVSVTTWILSSTLFRLQQLLLPTIPQRRRRRLHFYYSPSNRRANWLFIHARPYLSTYLKSSYQNQLFIAIPIHLAVYATQLIVHHHHFAIRSICGDTTM